MELLGLIDHDPLLTTMAAVSGGTAAIIGGFVLSTIINLASERSRLAQIVDELEVQQMERLHRIDSLSALQSEHLDKEVFNLLVEQFADERHNPSFEQCHAIAASLVEVKIDDFDNVIEDYRTKRVEAELFVNKVFEDFAHGDTIPDFREFLSDHPPGALHTLLVQQSFYRALNERNHLVRFSEPIGSVRKPESIPKRSEDVRLVSLDIDSQRREREIQDLRHRAEQDENILREKRADFEASALPRFVSFGVLVFAYQVVACVILPLSLVGGPSPSHSAATILSLRVLFDLQFASIFAYVVLLIRPFIHHVRPGVEPS